jgi:hypothetical protein
MAGFSRRRFVAGVAAFAGCAMVGTEAFAHGRKGKARHGGRKPGHVTGRHLAAAESASGAVAASPAPAEDATPAPETVASANLDTLGRLDPQGLIRKPLLAAAIVALDRHKDRITDHSRLFIADFSRHSSEARLYQVDMTTGEVTAFRTAHGRGSDPNRSGWARRFSNQPGSLASSVGAYVTLGESWGLRHGRHVGLDGLDPSNNLAKDRAIIVHSADYCEVPFLRAFGMLGRSEGCFATSSKELAELLPQMGQGRLLYAGV